ncbi:MAG: hypothetical protein INH41_15895 [Myxococcaceae bacterium]|nr:hypothetical protein [Myxococcaceae bacterium]MCA3013863.1 hypothetical protein [Myxococcaceae bacterium]
MNRSGLSLVVVALMACPPGPRTSREAPPVAVSAPPPEAFDAGWALTPARLEAWLMYHRSGRAAVDGGPRDALGQAKAALEAQRRLGLSDEDLERTDEVVAAVVAQRTIATLTGAEAVREFERVTLGLSAEQRQKMEQAFGDVRARARQLATLDAERARFGDAAVDAVLAREPEVTQVWNALLDGRGDPR